MNEITRLQEENKRLRAALRPFANLLTDTLMIQESSDNSRFSTQHQQNGIVISLHDKGFTYGGPNIAAHIKNAARAMRSRGLKPVDDMRKSLCRISQCKQPLINK